MSKSGIPQGPWFNPSIGDGTYKAVVEHIRSGTYRNNTQTYLQVVLRLPDLEEYVVSNFYFEKKDSRSLKRLNGLCKCIGGLVPQDAFDSPSDFAGAEIQVKIVSMPGQPGNGNRPYKDVAQFLAASSSNEAVTVETQPETRPVIYEMISYDD